MNDDDETTEVHTKLQHYDGSEEDQKDEVIEQLMNLVMKHQSFHSAREMFDFIVLHRVAMKIILKRWTDAEEDSDDVRRMISSVFFPLLG